MIRATWTVINVQRHALTLQEMTSQILTGLATGKYDQDVAFSEHVLTDIGAVFPPAVMIEQALEAFLAINKMTAPRSVIIPDGHGGMVPASNSRFDPATGEFL